MELAWPDLGVAVELRVTDVVPMERITFRNGDTDVSLEVSDGRLTLLHEGLTEDDDIDGFRSSWRVGLSLLAHAKGSRLNGPRRTRWAVRRAKTSTALAHVCFTESEALATWLGREARMGGEGEAYCITLGTGERMSGRVLVRDGGRDVALSWRERNDSVLVLRTLPSQESEDERVLAACWSRWGPTEPGEHATEGELRRAIDRLKALLAQGGNA